MTKSPSKQSQIPLQNSGLGQRILFQDIYPCLKFSEIEEPSSGIFLKKSKDDTAVSELSKAVMDNRCIIEPLPQKSSENLVNDTSSTTSSSSSSSSSNVCCEMCGKERSPKFRTTIEKETESKPKFSLTKKQSPSGKEWRNICQFCRDRLVSCADLFTFLRNVKMGYRKGHPSDLLRELLKLRLRVNFSRLVSH